MERRGKQRVVLAGAGHAHLYVASRAAEFRAIGAELVLIDPDAFWYSGLATGMLGGMYDAEQDRVDAQSLIEANGGRFIRDRVVGLDLGRRAVTLEAGEPVHYEAISFNIGSEVDAPDGLVGSDGVWTVKPIRGLWTLRQRLEAAVDRSSETGPLRLVVVGGGSTGCEVAANLTALTRRLGGTASVTLVSKSPRVLARQSSAASRRLTRSLRERGIRLEFGCRITHVDDAKQAVASDGRRFPYDELVLATGLKPSSALRGLGLPLGADGGLRVGTSLHSVGDERVFGAGDCISLEGHDLPKLGVFAVREAPVLMDNLMAVVAGGTFRKYRPQRLCLSILNLDGGEGLALWGPFHWHGRLSLWLKDRIDRRFLDRYRVRS